MPITAHTLSPDASAAFYALPQHISPAPLAGAASTVWRSAYSAVRGLHADVAHATRVAQATERAFLRALNQGAHS